MRQLQTCFDAAALRLLRLPWVVSMLLGAASIHVGQAATRSSEDYRLGQESLDGGGAQTTSAQYTHDGVLGGLGAVASAGLPVQTVRNGYVAGLYEPMHLRLDAFPVTLPEQSSRQLRAALRMDDHSVINVPAAGVSWSVLDGPLTHITANGVAHAASVYEATPATAQGIVQGQTATLELTVLDVDPDNFGTYAGDGLEDAWQVNFFGEENPDADPTRDPDGDGQDNAYENAAGTDPTDNASLFVLSIANVPGQPAHKALTFSPRFPSREYEVQYRSRLTAGAFVPLTGPDITDAGIERTVTDRHATNAVRFYRVEISPP